MDNAFEEVNRACCFNHMLQLSAKTLLKPFNAGMSSTKPTSEEEEFGGLDDEIPLLDDDALGDSEGDDNDSDEDGGEYPNGDGEPGDANDDEIDELSQLDELECDKILMNTAVIQQTVTKVCFDAS